MKYSIIASTPLRALIIGASLLAPRSVQSETVFLDDILALAPGINRLANFHRSLELDPAFYEEIDDDTVLEYLSGLDLNETLVQCVRDVNTLNNENPGMQEAEEEALSNTTVTIDVVDMETIAVTVEYPEEGRQIVRQQCADAGGYFETMAGDLFCYELDTDTGTTTEVTYSGFVTCMANTTSCTSPGRSIAFEMNVMISKAKGIDCELKDSSAALDSAGGKIAPSSFAFAGLLVAATSFVQM